MQNLKINAQRLWDTLMETAKFGGTTKGGINRLTLTDDDRQPIFQLPADAAPSV
jgi:beta-ureidopropionase / N-carbamoyl-L-amino-acid hydrolase